MGMGCALRAYVSIGDTKLYQRLGADVANWTYLIVGIFVKKDVSVKIQ